MPRTGTGSRWMGLLESLRTVGGTALDFVHTRVELFGVELRQELMRALGLMIRGIAALLLALLAAVFIGFALIVIFWDSHRELVAILVATFFALLAAAAIVAVKYSVDTRPRPFDSTLEALERDVDALRGDR